MMVRKPIVAVEEITPGRSHLFDVDGVKVLLVRVNEHVRATSAWCTHAGKLFAPFPAGEDGRIECPMHSAVFSSDDGELVEGPRCAPLPVYSVHISEDGMVLVDVPEAPNRPVVPAGPVGEYMGVGVGVVMLARPEERGGRRS